VLKVLVVKSRSKKEKNMRQRAFVVAVICVVAVAGVCQAADSNLKAEAGASYVSRYIWRGFDLYPDNHSAVQPFVNLTVPDSGWSGSIWMSRAIGSGFEDFEELDFTLAYGKTLYPDATYATDYKIGYTYYYYPDGGLSVAGRARSLDMDNQEFFANLSWPKVCPAGIVPSYTAVCMTQVHSGGPTNMQGNEGWFHIFGLAYDQAVPDLCPNNPDQALHWTAQMVYNDGAFGTTVDHDWSHAVFGLSTDFSTVARGTITPGIWWQSSWDDSVNTTDEWWFGITGSWPVN